MRVSRLVGIATSAALLLAPGWSPVLTAAEDEKKTPARMERKTDPVDKAETVAITTEDLLDRYGAPENPQRPPVPGKGEGTETDPEGTAGKATERKSHGTTTDPAADAAEKRKAAIETELERLEKRVASLRNPFLPRVEETDREKETESGMDNAEKVRRLETRIAALKAELATLR